jgi:hypothetical protein
LIPTIRQFRQLTFVDIDAIVGLSEMKNDFARHSICFFNIRVYLFSLYL